MRKLGQFLTVPLESNSTVPLYRQVYQRLREAILSGSLGNGAKLPATRTLASDLGIARNTVMSAYEQLLAEGYLEGQLGSGTYVSKAIPEDLLNAPAPAAHPIRASRKPMKLSRRGTGLAQLPILADRASTGARAFRTGLPACDAFPFEIWNRLTARRWRSRPASLMGYGDPAGYRPLREAIASYLGTSRAVLCSPDQVIVVSGSQQALDLVARLLLDPKDQAVIEDPGYLGARHALIGAGARLIAGPVDSEGLDIKSLTRRSRNARLVYVTPSHQYPLGVTMSVARRLELLEWAGRAGAWVLEDDYDSEYRYTGRPLAALQGLDREGRVIYTGTFSKVLFPALRLGYLVVPPGLVDAFSAARSLTDWHSMTVVQAVLADFMTEGHFVRHIRQMRTLYAERQAVLIKAADRELAGLMEVHPSDAGMQLVGWLPTGTDDVALAARARNEGVYVQPISKLTLGRVARPGLLLGYTGITRQQIREGMKLLARTLCSRPPPATRKQFASL